jgi:hypothetical protein
MAKTARRYSTPVGTTKSPDDWNDSVRTKDACPPPPPPCEVCSKMVFTSNEMPLVTLAVAVIVKVKST